MSKNFMENEHPGILQETKPNRAQRRLSFEENLGDNLFDAYVDQLVSGQGNGF